jgi:CubicO group peptidase (beta-lactamase class C family)
MGMKVTILAALLIWGGLHADSATAQHTLTQADVEAYVDGLVPYALRRADMAGAVVVVVKDGQVLFQKGYGVADVKTAQPVDPNATMFRPGSISKLFTWTAVMQLVEQGRLDLDRDVNSYLDFRIPDAFGKPITLRNLLTHTAGFEDVYKNGLVEDPKATPSVEAYVKRALPPRVFAPGTTVAYSNYGATLAG